MKSKLYPTLALLLTSLLITSVAQATVLRVITVKPNDTAAYVKDVERGQAVIKKLGSSAIIRVWSARFAGEHAGSIVVSVEYPDLATMAADEKKAAADSDYREWYRALQKTRQVVAESLYEEMKSTP